MGNIRLSYANDPRTNTLKILEQNHYYPFGLKHENYNSERRVFAKDEVAAQAQQGNPNPEGQIGMVGIGGSSNNNAAMKIIPGGGGGPVVYGERNYKYQGQERQDELGLNWDSFKWRNYDYAIGRFMSIDPLAEKYTYNSTYAFQENKMGMGRELEGLELVEIGFFSQTGFTSPLLSTGDVVKTSIDVGKISEVATEVSSKASTSGTPEISIFDKISDSISDAWDSITGSAEKTEIKPKNSMEQTAENAKPKGAEEKPNGTRDNPKKAAREAAKEKRNNQPGSEKRAKDYAKDLGKREGKDAQRKAHDAKDKVEGDRTVKQLKEDYRIK